MPEENFTLFYTKDTCSDYKKIHRSSYRKKIEQLLDIIKTNPFQTPLPFKRLIGPYNGVYSRRINLQHRLFYQVDEIKKRIKYCACGVTMGIIKEIMPPTYLKRNYK